MADNDLILLDGGMGRELQRRRIIAVKTIWSGSALIDAPDVVRDIHQEFILAGADVITTNSYGVVRPLLAMENMEHRLADLIQSAVRLAQEGRQASGRTVLIAGSLPPLGGSYRPELVGPPDELLAGYRELAGLLAPGVDILLGETLSTAREGRAAATAAAETGRPVWISWSLEDEPTGRLRSGETLKEALAALDGLPVEAVLFNCCSIEAIARALPELATLTDKRFGAYANAFQPLPKDYVMGQDGETPLRSDLSIEQYLEEATSWRTTGANIIGGCCGIGPDYIARIAQTFGKAA